MDALLIRDVRPLGGAPADVLVRDGCIASPDAAPDATPDAAAPGTPVLEGRGACCCRVWSRRTPTSTRVCWGWRGTATKSGRG